MAYKINIPWIILITICIIGSIGIVYLSNQEEKTVMIEMITPTPSIHNLQTPYVLQSTPKPTTISPTPTPLYYEKLQYPDEPCSQTLEIFNTKCMGRIKNESYCDYWEYQTRKNCKFIQW
jgi:hypothetical protein